MYLCQSSTGYEPGLNALTINPPPCLPKPTSLSMSDNKSVSHIPVLTGSTNYCAWWIKVDSYADFHGFSAAYEGKNKPADPGSPTSVETAGQRELKAKGLLKSTVSEIISQELYDKKVSLDTTKKMLDHLKDKYEKQGAITSLLNFTQLFEWWFADDGDLEGQLGRFYDIWSRCAVRATLPYCSQRDSASYLARLVPLVTSGRLILDC